MTWAILRTTFCPDLPQNLSRWVELHVPFLHTHLKTREFQMSFRWEAGHLQKGGQVSTSVDEVEPLQLLQDQWVLHEQGLGHNLDRSVMIEMLCFVFFMTYSFLGWYISEAHLSALKKWTIGSPNLP